MDMWIVLPLIAMAIGIMVLAYLALHAAPSNDDDPLGLSIRPAPPRTERPPVLEAQELLTLQDLLTLTGLPRTVVRLEMRHGTFPQPFSPDPGVWRWRRAEVMAWTKGTLNLPAPPQQTTQQGAS